jgi:diguanylate cyclase (GGDEF)-like protein
MTPASTTTVRHFGPGAPDEAARIAALHRLQALDKPRRDDLDRLARLAAYVCGAPWAAINLIDADRQWPAAAFGLDPTEVPRKDSMCAVSIRNHDVSYAPDASLDPRWAGNPFVTGVIDLVRFYADAPLVLSGGEVVGTVCAFDAEQRELSRLQIELLRDIADQAARLLELHDAADRLGRAALRDQLTGLPNRALLEESLDLALARYERGESRVAVVFLDLDGFKAVNDTFGHGVGDELLRAASERVLHAVRGSDLLARIGGDELVILAESGSDTASPEQLPVFVRRLRSCFDEPFALSVGPVAIGVSIGVASADGDAADQLLARADAAMYLDKRRRRAAS